MVFSEKNVTIIGWIASIMSIAMYFSYADQIRLNISGQTGSVVIPLVTVANCTAWMLYGLFKTRKDWPIVLCNIPGILFGCATAFTALIF